MSAFIERPRAVAMYTGIGGVSHPAAPQCGSQYRKEVAVEDRDDFFEPARLPLTKCNTPRNKRIDRPQSDFLLPKVGAVIQKIRQSTRKEKAHVCHL